MLCTFDRARAARRAQLGLGGLPRLQHGGELRAARPSRARPPRRSRAQRTRSVAGLFEGSRAPASRIATGPRTAAGTGCAGARRWPRTRRWSTPAPPTSPSAEAGRVRTREPVDRGRGTGPQRRPHRAAEPARARRTAAAGDGAGPPRRVRRSAWRSSTSTTSRPTTTPTATSPATRSCANARSPGTRSCAAPTRSSASAARSSSSSSPTARWSRRRRSIERLRAATPGEQTCSAGLACWDFAREHRRPGRPRRQCPLPGQGSGPRPARAVPADGVMMAPWATTSSPCASAKRGAIPS